MSENLDILLPKQGRIQRKCSTNIQAWLRNKTTGEHDDKIKIVKVMKLKSPCL
jgi:hypothetical protein